MPGNSTSRIGNHTAWLASLAKKYRLTPPATKALRQNIHIAGELISPRPWLRKLGENHLQDAGLHIIKQKGIEVIDKIIVPEEKIAAPEEPAASANIQWDLFNEFDHGLREELVSQEVRAKTEIKAEDYLKQLGMGLEEREGKRYITHPLFKEDLEFRGFQIEDVFIATTGNTLMIQETGMGKTNIAFLVAAHFLSQDPNAKIYISAPTIGLTDQHVKVARETFKDEIVINELTGGTHPKKRGEIWEKSSIIIGTPQTLAEELKKDKDLFQGGIDLREASFLVLDEAHKVVSKEDKYAYQEIVERYKKDNPAGLLLGICPTVDEQRMTDIRTKMGLDNIVRRTKKDPGVRESFHEITRQSVYIEALDTRALEDMFWAIMTEAFDRLRGIIYDAEQNRFEIISNRIGRGPGGYLPGIQDKINQYRSFLLESNIEITGRKGSQCYQLMHSLKKHLYQRLKYADFESIGKMLDHDIGAARKKDHKQKGKLLRRLKADWAMIGEVRHALQLARLDYIEELGKYLEKIKKHSHRKISYKWLSEDSRFENALSLLRKVDRLNKLREQDELSAAEEKELSLLQAHGTVQGLSGDPRTDKLLEILPEFKDKRVMIFVEYTDTAQKILEKIQALNDPEIKAGVFIGTRRMSRKKQKEALNKFREGEFNVLILTSAGEEGLDFKDAVVINFQAISRKKSRIQRRGRTGRREPGLEITLKTEGYEEKIDFIGAAREKSTDRSLKKLSKTDT